MFWVDIKLLHCSVKVIAQSTPSTAQQLNYLVPVRNIWPEKAVSIQCSLTETNQSSEMCKISMLLHGIELITVNF